jgi:DNA-binding XRE family transcriptional regulator
LGAPDRGENAVAYTKKTPLTVDEMRDRAVMTGPEIASSLRVSEHSVRLWETEGYLPVVKVGRRKFYPAEAVLRLMGVDPNPPTSDREVSPVGLRGDQTLHQTSRPCPCGCGYLVVTA